MRGAGRIENFFFDGTRSGHLTLEDGQRGFVRAFCFATVLGVLPGCPVGLATAAEPLRVGPLELTLDARLPFSSEQLATALALRLTAAEGRRIGVRVRTLGGAELRLESARKVRHLTLSETEPEAAARETALAILDLVQGELPVPAIPFLDARPRPREGPESPPTRGGPRLLLALGGTSGVGTNADRPLFGVALDGSLVLVRGLRAVLGVGLRLQPATDVAGGSLGLLGVPLRAGLGWRFGRVPLELRVTALLEPLVVSGEAQGRSLARTELLGGVGAAALYALRLVGPLAALFFVGADVFFSRAAYQVRGVEGPASQRVAFAGGLGLELGLGARR